MNQPQKKFTFRDLVKVGFAIAMLPICLICIAIGFLLIYLIVS